ncbi:hypothetical protein ACWDUL_20235 [Nocardia niigatensis]
MIDIDPSAVRDGDPAHLLPLNAVPAQIDERILRAASEALHTIAAVFGTGTGDRPACRPIQTRASEIASAKALPLPLVTYVLALSDLPDTPSAAVAEALRLEPELVDKIIATDEHFAFRGPSYDMPAALLP